MNIKQGELSGQRRPPEQYETQTVNEGTVQVNH